MYMYKINFIVCTLKINDNNNTDDDSKIIK